MRAHELIDVLGVGEVADLAAGVDPVKGLAGQCVPETDTTIGCASATAHHSVLVRGPSYGLDSCLMLAKLDKRLGCVGPIPDQQLVVVAS